MRRSKTESVWTGMRYGKLVVMSRGPDKFWRHDGKLTSAKHWWCLCDCGRGKLLAEQDLRRGRSISCNLGPCNPRWKHGKPPEYHVWASMKERCKNPKCTGYQHYGGRGIDICPYWENFENFYASMGPRPTPKHTLERIDNDGDYCPENCKWATATENARNTRRNHRITHRGETKTLTAWADEMGISSSTLRHRLGPLGWSIEDAMNKPLRKDSRRAVASSR